MKLVLLSFGRSLRGTPWETLGDDYSQRIRRYAQWEERTSRESRDDKVVREVEAVVSEIGPRAIVCVLDVKGRAFTSEGFSQLVDTWQQRAEVPVFLIGGAEGLPEAVRLKAHVKLSLGSMTLPHKLARIVLLEQLYRAFSILRGEPYARED